MAEQKGTDPSNALVEKRLRVLILSYHFPPLNVISSLRAEAFAKYLPAHGIEPTVLTLQWDPNEQVDALEKGKRYQWHDHGTPIREEFFHGAKIIRLPRVRTFTQRCIDLGMRIPILRGMVAFIGLLFGCFNLHAYHAHRSNMRYLRNYVTQGLFDLVIAMMSPDEHLKEAAWLKRRYGSLFIADYRDMYDNRLLSKKFRPGLNDKMVLWFKRYYHRKWITNSDLLVSVSAPVLTMLKEHTGAKKTLEIRNGYDPDQVESSTERIDGSAFQLTYAGSILPNQDLRPLIRTMNVFLLMLPIEERSFIKICFYAPRSISKINELQQGLPASNLVIAPRIAHAEMNRKLAESCILLMMDYGKVGMYSGKFMEYIGFRRNILQVASDHGVVADLIHKGHLGLASDDPHQAASYLFDRYKEWRSTGAPTFVGDEMTIAGASRKEQTAKFALEIRKMF